jgi:hypothetical protein
MRDRFAPSEVTADATKAEGWRGGASRVALAAEFDY